MKAVKIIKPGQAVVVTDAPVPELPSPDYLLVKVVAVALNPTDWIHVQRVDGKATVGCDFAGTVEEVGPAVTMHFKKGDRVWGFVQGSNPLRPGNSAFQEYVAAKLVMPIPEGVSFEEAAGLGIATITVGQGLYQEMQLPWPDKPLTEKKQILIWGGSSGMGVMGIQFSKLSGFEVLTTCSPKNFEYVKSLGADHVFDAYDPNVGKKIREFTDNKLYYVWDCIGAPEQCAEALASSAPAGQEIIYGNIVNSAIKFPRDDVTRTYSVGCSASGEEWEIGWLEMKMKVPAQPDHYQFMRKWFILSQQLLMEGKWKPHRQEVREGGFEGILKGLEDMKEGRVSAAKLIYRVSP